MKALLPFLCAITLLISLSWSTPVSLKLKDGSILKGEVTPLKSNTATDITVTTEFGIVRVPVDKLTPESKAAVGVGQPMTVAQYEAKISQLEQRIKSLEEENARLRREQATRPSSPVPASAYNPPTPRSFSPQSTKPVPDDPPASGGAYTISSTGKRHNARCRYYGSGRACGPSDGVACKICGG